MTRRSALVRAAWLLLLASWGAGCGDSSAPLGSDPGSNNAAGAACREDDDCPFDEVCDRGTCAPFFCREDGDCASDQRCEGGVCRPDPDACARNSDCDEGEVCSPDTLRCVPTDGGPQPCQSDRECLNGQSCVEGACQAEEVECREDRDCPLGQSCDEGRCAAEPCDDALGCPDGAFCHPDTGTCAVKSCEQDADCLAALDFCAQRDECGQPWACACVEGACEVLRVTVPCPDAGPDAPTDLPTDADDPREDATPDTPTDDAPPEDARQEDTPTDPDASPDLPTHNNDDPNPNDAEPDAQPDDDINPPDVEPDAPPDNDINPPDVEPDAPADDADDAGDMLAVDDADAEPDMVAMDDTADEPDADAGDMVAMDDTADEPDMMAMDDADMGDMMAMEDADAGDMMAMEDADAGDMMAMEDADAGDMMAMEDADMGDVPFTPPPTPAPGTYRYARLPIGGVKALRKVEFHPDGTYAAVLEERNRVHLVDWASREARVLDLTPSQGAYVWEDLRFDPSGDFALLVGWHEITSGNTTTKTGLIVRLDDLAARTGGDATDVLEVYPSHGVADPIHALRYPRGGGLPVVLARRNERSPYWAILRDFDPQTGFAGSFAPLTQTSAGCDDFDFVNNEFGDPGILVVCGFNGADTHYYTEVGGVGEWRADPGNNNLGNTSSVAAYPTGDYALVLSWSGRSVYRFEGGLLNGYSDAPRFSSRAIHSVKFQQEGQRALIVGGAFFGSNEQIGIVIEYRHDLYRCASPGTNCDLTYAHIQGFNAPPYNATSNTTLRDSAFRPGCDGGLVVSGFTDFQNNVGQIIEFQIEGARPCR